MYIMNNLLKEGGGERRKEEKKACHFANISVLPENIPKEFDF